MKRVRVKVITHLKTLALAALALMSLLSVTVRAGQTPAEQQALIREARIEQRLDSQAPLDAVFRDENGREVRLGDYFDGKPVVLALVYYDCPMLCTFVLNGLTNSLTDLRFNVGREFNVVTVSFDPRETPALAAAKKETYVRRYGRAQAAAGWHFLTGDETNIRRLADAVGFHYAFDPETGQFAHASAIMILTPEGRVSRYFYGIEYPPRDVRLGLVEASEGRIGSPVDQVLLLCYHYDVTTGKYAPIAMNVMRLGGILTVIALAALFLIMRRKEKGKGKADGAVASAKASAQGMKARETLSRLSFIVFPLRLFPDAASTEAEKVDTFFFFMLAVCGLVAAVVICLIIIFSIRYRRRTKDQLALEARTVRWLEVTWTVIPLFIFIGMFLWGAQLYFSVARPPADALVINAIGKQWMWKFQHAEGQREINELHVPVGRAVKLVMTSQDVIHSFFVPEFRIHQDVLPGRYTETWFKATKTGRFHLFCSQYCGAQHSGMVGEVVVMEPDEYQRWLTAGGEGSLASEGQKLFRQLACNACHTGDSQARAPALGGLYGSFVRLDGGATVRADETYLRESIVNPRARVVAGFQPLMPTFQNQLDEDQLLELITYIKTLGVERRQIPPTFTPGAPQPAPVGDAIRNSEGSSRP